MPDLAAHAGLVYAALVVLAFTSVALWELRRPLAAAAVDLNVRWLTNFGLLVLNHAAAYLIVPAVAVLTAWWATTLGPGLLTRFEFGVAAQVLLTLVALDAVRWATHVLLHRWPLLWRVHQVHHCDTAFDCTVGVRFHPLEAALVVLVSSITVLALGASPLAVVLAEALFIAHNFFCHANATLPPRAEALLRRLLITPDLHRVHHALDGVLSNRNFGTVLSMWDRLAGTLHELPHASAGTLQFGVAGVPAACAHSLPRLLWLPLQREPGRGPGAD